MDSTNPISTDVTAIPGGTLITPVGEEGEVRYCDEALILLAHTPQTGTGLPLLHPISEQGDLYPKLNPFIKRWTGFDELEDHLPALITRMIDENLIERFTPLFVCTESKAAAILATQTTNTTLRMQTSFAIRSTLQ